MEETIRLTQFSKGGGCGCKIAPAVLQQIIGTAQNPAFDGLLVGNESSDDAAVFKIDDNNCIISTTDFFVPIVDDPFHFGQIAAANAISDVYAMGGSPLMAIAILGWPIDKLSTDEAKKVLEGGRAACLEAGIPLAGGHTIDSSEPIFGLAVTGNVTLKNLKKNNTAAEGDFLFLTKPVGVGIMTTALKRGLLSAEDYAPLVAQLTSLNKIGKALGAIDAVHAMTDVTGFGVMGHLIELAEGSGLGAELYYSTIQKPPALGNYLKQRTLPDATFRNWNSYNSKVQFEKGVDVMEAFNLLPDPQTNGGLLVAVVAEGVDEIKALFVREGLDAFTQPIGKLTAKGEKVVVVKP